MARLYHDLDLLNMCHLFKDIRLKNVELECGCFQAHPNSAVSISAYRLNIFRRN
jgi:hypothetical protein